MTSIDFVNGFEASFRFDKEEKHIICTPDTLKVMCNWFNANISTMEEQTEKR